MTDDPNEIARRAFGDAGPAGRPAPAPPPSASAAELYGRPGPRDVPARQFADWWTRAGAFLLDQLVIAGIVMVAVVVALLVVDDPGSRASEIVAYAVAIPLGFLYAPLLMARGGARNGQTLGKQVVGIRVVCTDGAPIAFWTGFLRTVVAQQLLIAITFYVYAVVDYLWPLRDPQNQALHDKIAKTWVVRTSPTAEAPPAVTAPPVPDEAPVHHGWLPPQAPGA
jgi:uncharacterized RDD family membrane protein YckC